MPDGGRCQQMGGCATVLMPFLYLGAAKGGSWNNDHNVPHGRKRMKETGILVNF